MMSNKYLLKDFDRNLKNIVQNGFLIDGDRTGVGTTCLFGLNCEIDLSGYRVPISTKRKVTWQSIVKEVLWYISGSSNIGDLEDMGAGIWTPWRSEEFENKHGFESGSAGYVYGFNLIHYGADVKDENPKGFNQLDYVINTLRDNPKSRQACFTFWRPDTNDRARLPACHAFYTFIVSPDAAGDMSILNLHIAQRSNDYPIGVLMGNLFTGSLFVRMIAQQLNMRPGKLYHSGAHCHVYNNSLAATKEYLSRKPAPDSPLLRITKAASIYDYTIDHFELAEYDPLPAIKFEVAV